MTQANQHYCYKDIIIYSLDVETYQDSDGNGVGDFRGLLGRLDHLADLGVDCLWLLPFYPSPNRDNRYDVLDYCEVDPRLGTLEDFDILIRATRERGMRVLIDLVSNHTSIEHPWFQEARRNPHSKYRNYYIWEKVKPDPAGLTPAFPGFQDTVWTYDEKAGAYYRHQFYHH